MTTKKRPDYVIRGKSIWDVKKFLNEHINRNQDRVMLTGPMHGEGLLDCVYFLKIMRKDGSGLPHETRSKRGILELRPDPDSGSVDPFFDRGKLSNADEELVWQTFRDLMDKLGAEPVTTGAGAGKPAGTQGGTLGRVKRAWELIEKGVPKTEACKKAHIDPRTYEKYLMEVVKPLNW